MRARMGKWLRSHWKALLVHSLVLSGFLLFRIFLSDPLFGRFEAVDGESKLQNISLPTESESMRIGIDDMKVGTYVAEVHGWAFIDGQSSENSQIYIVLKSDHKYYAFDTMTQLRPSVTSVYDSSNVNLDLSGFACYIPLREISSGEYLLGIYVKNGDIGAFQTTDRVLVKS
jgi:hypothetical protein